MSEHRCKCQIPNSNILQELSVVDKEMNKEQMCKEISELKKEVHRWIDRNKVLEERLHQIRRIVK